jgi:predicted secreted hydrolase
MIYASLGLLFGMLVADRYPLTAAELAYLSVTGPCHLEFPKDHKSHPGYRTEWWYYTGNLHSETGKRYGFQLTFFRIQISPPDAQKDWPQPASKWRTSHLYLAHAAISDLSGHNHLHAQQIARSALNIAGATPGPPYPTIFIRNWYAKISPESHRIKAATDAFKFELNLKPVKGPILHGEDGYSRKGSSRERASCYYSFTRLETRGTIRLAGKTTAVNGLSWMDHEFSTAPLEPGLAGWDWFSLILSNQTELMVYLLRQEDGSFSLASSGTFVDPSGNSRHLTRNEFKVDVLDTWKSLASGAVYPASWRLTVLPLSLEVFITSNLADQEMLTTESTGITYWEGSVSVKGTVQNLPVEGQGYVELTGYAKPFDAPM